MIVVMSFYSKMDLNALAAYTLFAGRLCSSKVFVINRKVFIILKGLKYSIVFLIY